MNEKISFLEIPEIIQGSMEHIAFRGNPDIAGILETEQEVYQWIESRW